MINQSLEYDFETTAYNALKIALSNQDIGIYRQRHLFLNNLYMGRIDLYVSFPKTIVLIEVKYDMDLHSFENADGQLSNYKRCEAKRLAIEGQKKKVVCVVLCHKVLGDNTALSIKLAKRKVFINIENLIDYLKEQQ
jgi:Holliday junction resolvase-like predicted endonuclease